MKLRMLPQKALLLSWIVLAAAPAGAQWVIETVDAQRPPIRGGCSLKMTAAGDPAIAFGGDRLILERWDGTRWVLDVVDATGCGFSNPCLALDGAGSANLAYFDETAQCLKLARFDGAAWKIEVVDSTGGPIAPSLALDGAGNPVISYDDGVKGDLKLARFDGAAWTIQIVDSGGDVGYDSSIALDAAGNPLISYYDATNADLKVARFDGTTWTLQTVDGVGADVGRGTSLALDAAGHPVISYVDATSATLHVAAFDGSSWTITTVDGAKVAQTSLALDGGGRIVIGYAGVDWERTALWDGSTWQIDVPTWLFTFGRSVSFDPVGAPVLAFLSCEPLGNFCRLLYSTRVGSTWDPRVVYDTDSGPGTGSSIRIDSTGNPVITYSASIEGWRLARRNGNAWAIEKIEWTLGPCDSLALDSADRPVLACAASGLFLGRWDGSAWSVEIVTGLESRNPSLGLDSADNPAIAYFTKEGVKLATKSGSTWTISNLSTPPLPDAYPSCCSNPLAMDATDQPAVAFWKTYPPDIALELWGSAGAPWVAPALITWGHSASLAFDPAGNPGVAFSKDGSEQGLAYMHWNGTSWDYALVDALVTDPNPSLAFEPSGNPAIAYYAGDSKPYPDVKFARWRASGWAVTTLESGSVVDRSRGPSLAFDAAGNPWISYGGWVTNCGTVSSALRLATFQPAPAVMYRGEVASLPPGWKSLALPLDDLTDVPSAHFPMPVTTGGSADDLEPSSLPLSLYRVLLGGTADAGNNLLASKLPGGGVHLEF